MAECWLPAAGRTNNVQFSTFKKWNVSEIFGVDVALVEGRETVIKVWCKTCRKHADKIRLDDRLRGQAKTDCLAYAEGSTNVVKSGVMRHLTSRVSIS